MPNLNEENSPGESLTERANSYSLTWVEADGTKEAVIDVADCWMGVTKGKFGRRRVWY